MFLTGMVAMIMLRTLKRDITSYNAEEDVEVCSEKGFSLVLVQPRTKHYRAPHGCHIRFIDFAR